MNVTVESRDEKTGCARLFFSLPYLPCESDMVASDVLRPHERTRYRVVAEQLLALTFAQVHQEGEWRTVVRLMREFLLHPILVQCTKAALQMVEKGVLREDAPEWCMTVSCFMMGFLLRSRDVVCPIQKEAKWFFQALETFVLSPIVWPVLSAMLTEHRVGSASLWDDTCRATVKVATIAAIVVTPDAESCRMVLEYSHAFHLVEIRTLCMLAMRSGFAALQWIAVTLPLSTRTASLMKQWVTFLRTCLRTKGDDDSYNDLFDGVVDLVDTHTLALPVSPHGKP